MCIFLSPSFALSSALDYFLGRKPRMYKTLSQIARACSLIEEEKHIQRVVRASAAEVLPEPAGDLTLQQAPPTKLQTLFAEDPHCQLILNNEHEVLICFGFLSKYKQLHWKVQACGGIYSEGICCVMPASYYGPLAKTT